MANKFQNRLVGTIILVVLGVVVLPSLLDGKKEHYQGESAIIPLVLTPSNGDEFNVAPLPCQKSPSQPLKDAGQAREQLNLPIASLLNADNSPRQLETLVPPEIKFHHRP